MPCAAEPHDPPPKVESGQGRTLTVAMLNSRAYDTMTGTFASLSTRYRKYKQKGDLGTLTTLGPRQRDRIGRNIELLTHARMTNKQDGIEMLLGKMQVNAEDLSLVFTDQNRRLRIRETEYDFILGRPKTLPWTEKVRIRRDSSFRQHAAGDVLQGWKIIPKKLEQLQSAETGR